ncbi:MAG: 2,3-bisphosphoglycerate-independent phosphoglycerate mutase [Cognaticolwellia sp.]|jgi:2,3-bisphosphoglycerate-independent phosphoglycerate mutase
MNYKLPDAPNFPGRGVPHNGPVVLCILDGVGLGLRDGGDAVYQAHTPTLDRLFAGAMFTQLKAHGTAVGLPSDGDMGNSEVGHNALGAGRIIAQGAKLVAAAFKNASAFGETWEWLTQSGTLHLLGLLSDGGVHSHIDHLLRILKQADSQGIERVRIHILSDGRDVGARSVLGYIRTLEAALSGINGRETLVGEPGRDYRIASGGGRMNLTMDRYEADWSMVQRGWNTHVLGEGRRFESATQAVEALYAEDAQVNDQYLPAFVIEEGGQGGVEPIGVVQEGDGMLLFNFRGDRALEFSSTAQGQDTPVDRGGAPSFRFAGIMQYDGDLKIPARYLVEPPAIDATVGHYLAANGRRSFVVSETQKFGHVTFFFNGNRSGMLDSSLEEYVEIPSDVIPFEQAPAMKAQEITQAAIAAISSGTWDHVRLNIANGDMVGHSGDLAATITAMEVVDACVADLEAAVVRAGGVLLVTADHGNADDMWMRDKQDQPKKERGSILPKTSHTLAPVPFAVVDPQARWELSETPNPGLANISATLLLLCGLTPPIDYLPSLLQVRP